MLIAQPAMLQLFLCCSLGLKASTLCLQLLYNIYSRHSWKFVFLQDTSDTCFERSSSIDVTGLTGVAAIGHRLETGVQCQFRLAYKLVSKAPIVKSVDCTIQSN